MGDDIEAVLFDFHSTLVDNGQSKQWLLHALRRERSSAEAKDDKSDEQLLDEFAAQLIPVKEEQQEQNGKRLKSNVSEQPREHLQQFLLDLNRVWEIAKDVDPKTLRDLSPLDHERVFKEILSSKEHWKLRRKEDNENLAHFLYLTVSDNWCVYSDTKPTLDFLKYQKGKKLGLISNVGFDIRPVLDREGILPYFDCILLSCEFGQCKPSKQVFLECCNLLKVSPKKCLMVGDDYLADGGAALCGIRTLILPKTPSDSPLHGLDWVCKLCM